MWLLLFADRFGHGMNALKRRMLQSVSLPTVRIPTGIRSLRRKPEAQRMSPMPVALPVAIALLAEEVAAASARSSPPVYGPAPPAPKASNQPTPAEPGCAQRTPDPNAREIVVCAPRPQGYRLDPDVLEARRERKAGAAGRPRNPHESYADNSCATIGPMGCRGGPTINLVAAAATLAAVADRLAKGQEVGSIFANDPTPSEYQLYLEAKKRREAKTADAAAKAKIATMQAAAQAKTHQPPAPNAALIQKQ
jgi:hypothetical protein